jgi:NADH-dependent peroxiredoxin subunit F
MDKIYDVIIIGAGPAGITAAVYCARKYISCIVLTKDIGGQASWSGDIENYTGYQFITGPELVSKFEEHLKEYNIEIRENEPVEGFSKKDNLFEVKTSKSVYLSRTIIIASGKRSKDLNVLGEEGFRNKGVTYCATCDGPLFGGKDVVIAGGGNSALDAAIQLMKIANKVYIVNVSSDLTGDSIVREKVLKNENVTVFNSTEITEIKGEKFVSSVKIRNTENGEEKELSSQGVFVEIGLVPNSVFTSLIDKNEKGEVTINCQSETNIPGVFAAGDVTNVMEKQIIIAAGEGAKAALRAFNYISRQEK